MQQNIFFIYNALSVLFEPIINWVVSLCKRVPENYSEKFITACQIGDIDKVKTLLEKHKDLEKDEGLIVAVMGNQENVAKLLLEKGDIKKERIDDCLRVACRDGHISMAELMVQKGARTIVGLRVAKSPNIIDMLYRYEQKPII